MEGRGAEGRRTDEKLASNILFQTFRVKAAKPRAWTANSKMCVCVESVESEAVESERSAFRVLRRSRNQMLPVPIQVLIKKAAFIASNSMLWHVVLFCD